MKSHLMLLLAVVWAIPTAAKADERWSASAEALVMSAPALPGVVLGGMAEGRLSLSPTVHLTLQLGGGSASDSNETWDISQTHLLALAGAGVSRTLGRARLSADLLGGALIISELDQRHQIQRLTEANIPDRQQSSLAAGPLLAIELGIDLELFQRWFVRLSGGPQATWLSVDGARRLHAGVFTGLGVTHAF